jgi:hypothetical protein
MIMSGTDVLSHVLGVTIFGIYLYFVWCSSWFAIMVKKTRTAVYMRKKRARKKESVTKKEVSSAKKLETKHKIHNINIES